MDTFAFHISRSTSRLRTFAGLIVLLAMLPGRVDAKPSSETIASFKQARVLLDEDPARAYALAKELPKLRYADQARLALLADAATRSLHVEEAVEWLEKLEDATSSTSDRFRTRLERAELLAVLGDVAAATKLSTALNREKGKIRVRSADRRFLRSRLLRLRHDLAIAADDESAAHGMAEDLLISYPNEEATKRPGLARNLDDLSTAERYRRAQQLMDSWGYHAARVEFERLVDTKKYSYEARWNLGVIALRKLRDRPKEAEALFKKLSRESGSHQEEALYYLARSQMRQERYDDARKTFKAYIAKYPSGKERQLADYYEGWLHYDHRENEKALKGFKNYIDKYGRRSRKSSFIYGFNAWALMRLKRWDAAVGAWDSMMGFGNPLVEGKARYWKAYALRELGRNDDAIKSLDKLRKRWPLTYYSMLGEQLRARIEGRDERASQVWWPEGGGELDDSPRIDIENYRYGGLPKSLQDDWQRVLSLAALGEKHLARDELKSIYGDLERRVPEKEKDEWVHAVGRLVGDYHPMWKRAAGRTGISGRSGMVVDNDLRSAMLYPRAYREIVDDVAKEFGLYPGFIWAIMRQESRYKPGAVSYTDAVGALQMIPKTARKVARDMGTVYNVATFFRPEVGFRFSGYYMRKIHDTFDGLWVPSAASYNSGPEVVAKWFRKNPEAEFAWLIEEFEYNEGRAYCRKVSEHMLRYLYLYEKDPARRGEVLDKMFPLSRDIQLADDVGY